MKTGPTGPNANLHREANYRRASFTDSRVQMQVPAVQVAQRAVKDPQTQSIVKELRFQVRSWTHEGDGENCSWAGTGQTRIGGLKKQGLQAKQYPQDVQERADLTTAIRSVHETFEVPKVQYIDKVADINVEMQRQVSTIQVAQHIDEVVDVSALAS